MDKNFTFLKKSMNPKDSTIQSILNFSKSVKSIKTESLQKNIILFLN